MLAFNSQLFLLINAPAHPYPTTVALAEFAASGVIILIPFLLAALWIWGDPAHRAGLAATAVVAALALGANQFLGLLWHELRPFMIGLGRTLIAHPPENSFPSNHTTLMVTVGLSLIITRAGPAWGKVVILLGLLVAWARIYLGLHFPIDMLTSGVVGGCFGGASAILVPPINRWAMPLAEPIYEGALRLLHLPICVFPRRP